MKIKIIICYYGRFPVWIESWLKSCQWNSRIQFMIVTDLHLENMPDNVELLYETFEELKGRFSRALGMKVCLDTPYKLCDYKPLYGIAFKNELEDFDFWGHCDMDMIFGDIRSFFTEDVLGRYDRLGSFGHLILYRNTKKINTLYKKKGAAFPYKRVFASKFNYGFDEQFGYNLICKKQRIDWLDCGHTLCLDRCHQIPFQFAGIDNYVPQWVLWKEGHIYQIYLDEHDNLVKKEKMYFHFSGKRYELDLGWRAVIFDYNKCTEIDEKNLKEFIITQISDVYSSRQIEEHFGCSDITSKLKRFNERTLYQKYIYIRQKAAYYLS